MANKALTNQPGSNKSYEEKWIRVTICRVSKSTIWEEIEAEALLEKVWLEWGVDVSWDVIWDIAARG